MRDVWQEYGMVIILISIPVVAAIGIFVWMIIVIQDPASGFRGPLH